MDSVFSGMKTRFSSSPKDSLDSAKLFKQAKRGCLSHYDDVINLESDNKREFTEEIRSLLSKSKNMQLFTDSLNIFLNSDSYRNLALSEAERIQIKRCLNPQGMKEGIAKELAKQIFEIVKQYFIDNP